MSDDARTHLQGQVLRQVDRIAERLTTLAEEVRELKDEIPLDQPLHLARRVENELRWGVANLPLGSLLAAVEDLLALEKQ